MTTVSARVPEFTRPGFRWNVTQRDEHLWVAIQHDGVRVGRLHCWVDSWRASVCLHERDATEAAEVQGELDAVVAILFGEWARVAADVEISQAAAELAHLDERRLIAGGDWVLPPPSNPVSRRLRSGVDRVREVGLGVVTTAVAAPLGLHVVAAAVGEASAGTYARAMNHLSVTATTLALRRSHR